MGVAKDIQNNQVLSNLILYHQIYYKCSLRESYEALIHIHDQAVTCYDALANILLAKVEEHYKERFATFLMHLRYMDSGFGFWHRDCIRYQQYIAIEYPYYFKLSINDSTNLSTCT